MEFGHHIPVLECNIRFLVFCFCFFLFFFFLVDVILVLEKWQGNRNELIPYNKYPLVLFNGRNSLARGQSLWLITVWRHSLWPRLISYLDLKKYNYISNRICTKFGSPIIGEMKFHNYILFQMKLNKLTKCKANYILS